MAHSFTSLFTHLIFSTKERRPLLVAQHRPRIFQYMGGILRNIGGTSLLINGVEDHVHVLALLPASIALSDVLRDLKGDSSRWCKETLGQPEFAWQTGYAAFSVSKSGVQAVREYVATQEEHHSRVALRDEYLEFLKRHEIEYDERFVFA